MATLLEAYNAAVMAGYPFGTDTIVDIGGGDGSLLVGILKANPQARGVLFDLPHVSAKANEQIAAAGLGDRCKVVGGDAFISVPAGGDAYVLSRIMDSWDDERAGTILSNCHGAMSPGAKLLLIERVLPERVDNSPAVRPLVMSDLNMMVITGGRERTASEYARLLESAGFSIGRIIPSQSVMTIIECARL